MLDPQLNESRRAYDDLQVQQAATQRKLSECEQKQRESADQLKSLQARTAVQDELLSRCKLQPPPQSPPQPR